MTVSMFADASGAHVFKYDRLTPVGASLLVLISIFIFFSGYGAANYGYRDGLEIFFLFIPIFLLFGVLAAIFYSDVILRAECISRSLYGWSWNVIEWKDVDFVESVELPRTRGNRALRDIRVIPTLRSKKGGSYKMIFGDDMDGYVIFVDKINIFLSENGIKVRRIDVNGCCVDAGCI
ncbi:MAG: hypothetical protein WA777_13315 [Rhodanobacter sp.]